MGVAKAAGGAGDGLGPHLAGMENPQDRHCLPGFRINDNVVWPHDHFACPCDATNAISTRMGWQFCDTMRDVVAEGLCRFSVIV